MPEEGKSREAGWARLDLLLWGVVGAVVVVVWSAADILLFGGVGSLVAWGLGYFSVFGCGESVCEGKKKKEENANVAQNNQLKS